MALTFEKARNIKFNLRMILISNVLLLIVGVIAAYKHTIAGMTPAMLADFNDYNQALLRSFFMPVDKTDSLNYLNLLRENYPHIKAEFDADLTFIFKWTPIGICISNSLLWLFGLAFQNYLKQKKGLPK